MSFSVITEDGELRKHAKTPSPAMLTTLFGQQATTRVAVEWGDMRGIISGYGLTHDGWNTVKRNPAGACVLAALGAEPSVVAGPVVFTGWDTARDEPAPLREWALTVVADIYVAVDNALAGLASGHGQPWDAAVFRMGHIVKNFATPLIILENFQ